METATLKVNTQGAREAQVSNEDGALKPLPPSGRGLDARAEAFALYVAYMIQIGIPAQVAYRKAATDLQNATRDASFDTNKMVMACMLIGVGVTVAVAATTAASNAYGSVKHGGALNEIKQAQKLPAITPAQNPVAGQAPGQYAPNGHNKLKVDMENARLKHDAAAPFASGNVAGANNAAPVPNQPDTAKLKREYDQAAEAYNSDITSKTQALTHIDVGSKVAEKIFESTGNAEKTMEQGLKSQSEQVQNTQSSASGEASQANREMGDTGNRQLDAWARIGSALSG